MFFTPLSWVCTFVRGPEGSEELAAGGELADEVGALARGLLPRGGSRRTSAATVFQPVWKLLERSVRIENVAAWS